MESIDASGVAERLHRPLEPGSPESDLFERARTNGSATNERIRPRLRDDDVIVADGTVYRVQLRVTDQEPALVVPIKLNDLAYDGVTVGPDDERIQFSELPAVDRRVFREHDLADGELMGIGTSLVYTESAVEQSVLVPTPEYTIIVWGPDTRGRFTVRGEPREEQLSTYRYTFETEAESARDYGERVIEEYAVSFADVSAAEADILATASERDDGYAVERGQTPSEAFQSVTDRFRDVQEVDAVRDDVDSTDEERRAGTYLVRYDGGLYWTHLGINGPETTT